MNDEYETREQIRARLAAALDAHYDAHYGDLTTEQHLERMTLAAHLITHIHNDGPELQQPSEWAALRAAVDALEEKIQRERAKLGVTRS